MLRHLFSPAGLVCIQRLATQRSVLIFDFDGTLAPIVSHPNDAKIPAQTAQYLMTMSRSWPIAVVTGRSVEDVRKKLGFTPDFLFGNHGAERSGRLTPHHLHENLNACRQWLVTHRSSLLAHQVWVEDKGLSLALHYRQSENPVKTRAWLHELMRSATENSFLSDGHMVLNIVSTHAPDKGDALQTILQESGVTNALVVGDDENDEAAFAKAPEHAVTVRIGAPGVRTGARFGLSGQKQVNSLLTILMIQRKLGL